MPNARPPKCAEWAVRLCSLSNKYKSNAAYAIATAYSGMGTTPIIIIGAKGMRQADNETVAMMNPDAPRSASVFRVRLGAEVSEKGFQDLEMVFGAGVALERWWMSQAEDEAKLPVRASK